jgi:putative membrane protein
MEGLIMMIGSTLLFLLVAYLVWKLILDNNKQDSAKPSARQLLDERFAKGEIDQDEYQAKKSLLDKNHET